METAVYTNVILRGLRRSASVVSPINMDMDGTSMFLTRKETVGSISMTSVWSVRPVNTTLLTDWGLEI